MARPAECPYCAMVRGENHDPWSAQSDIVYRDAKTTAWVNGRWSKNAYGSVVIVPNAHVENLSAVDPGLGADLYATAQRIAAVMATAFACDRVSIRQHNRPGGSRDVWHYHVHVLGRREGVDPERSDARSTRPEERAPYAEALRGALRR